MTRRHNYLRQKYSPETSRATPRGRSIQLSDETWRHLGLVQLSSEGQINRSKESHSTWRGQQFVAYIIVSLNLTGHDLQQVLARHHRLDYIPYERRETNVRPICVKLTSRHRRSRLDRTGCSPMCLFSEEEPSVEAISRISPR